MGVIGKTIRFTLGIGLGAGLGAVAAMLAAPQSGKVTKEQIQSRLDEVVNAGKKAQQERERELQDYWEQEVQLTASDKEDKAKKEKDSKKDDKK
jgi:gas vesicle protein